VLQFEVRDNIDTSFFRGAVFGPRAGAARRDLRGRRALSPIALRHKRHRHHIGRANDAVEKPPRSPLQLIAISRSAQEFKGGQQTTEFPDQA